MVKKYLKKSVGIFKSLSQQLTKPSLLIFSIPAPFFTLEPASLPIIFLRLLILTVPGTNNCLFFAFLFTKTPHFFGFSPKKHFSTAKTTLFWPRSTVFPVISMASDTLLSSSNERKQNGFGFSLLRSRGRRISRTAPQCLKRAFKASAQSVRGRPLMNTVRCAALF